MMKKILITSMILCSLISCKAQQVITPIFYNAPPAKNPNNYYKDVDLDFDKFLGTWTYQNGNDEFTIELQKELMINDNNGTYLYDEIYGEYLYIKNGIIINNTIPNINNVPMGYNHISGNSLIHKANNPICDTCTLQERRVQLLISVPNTKDIMGWFTLRYINTNGIEKLEAKITSACIMGYDQQDYNKMPWGDFVLIKQ